MCKFFCVDTFFSVLSMYLGVELLDHMVTVTFWRIVKLFFKVAGLFYIPTNSEWRFQFLCICTILAFIHLRLIILVDVKYILCFLFAFPKWLMMLNIFLCTYWLFVYILSWIICSCFFAHFLLICLTLFS